jgi:hypothetical protein
MAEVVADFDGPGEFSCFFLGEGERRKKTTAAFFLSLFTHHSNPPPHPSLPAGTPYEGGTFRLRLDLGPDFPAAPPKGTFLTKLFHPNVSGVGEVCVNVLKKDWKVR